MPGLSHNAKVDGGGWLIYLAVFNRAIPLNKFKILFILPSFNGFIYNETACKSVGIFLSRCLRQLKSIADGVLRKQSHTCIQNKEGGIVGHYQHNTKIDI